MNAGIYRHYKGDYYMVLGIGEHTETREHMVVYISLTQRPGCRLRLRPAFGKDGFFTPLSGGTPRFAYVGDEVPGIKL
jgi:hypothetical protein